MDNYGQFYREGQPAGKADADIDSPEAWDLTTGSPDVRIAILDSGADQDLDKGLQKNFTDSTTVDDLYGHGTHMAGTAAAQINNDSAVGYSSWVAQGIRWATDTGGAKVINMSLGVGKSRTLQDAVDYAWSKDVVVVAAAGNGNNTAGVYPARYTHVLGVAATDPDDKKTSISSYST